MACAVSWGIAVWFAGRLWAAYPLVSVRSDVPVTGRQLEALRSALRQEDGASALVPAFWSQAEGSAESRWETCGITAILYCGEYDAVYPAVLLEGRFPAAQENGKCAVSTAAAWQLWGSEDVLGQELEIEGDIYRVCGLFRSSASLALCGESLDHGFSNIEFWGGYAAPPVETVQQLLRAAGIAQQVTLYFPFPWMAALTAYALCPAGLVLLAAARTLGGRVRKGCPKETCWFVLGGAFLLALVLPALLRLLPPWITPARWSDFSYWGGLLPAVGKAIETGFSLNPCAKDVLAKWNTLGLLIAATLANAAAGKLMFTILEPGTGSDGSDSGEVSNVPDSKLVTKFIPAYEGNYTKDRKAQGGTISEITIHHCASILTIDALGALWQREGRKGSSHYGVSETNIGQYVHESDVAWTNGNWEANCRAVTIETSNSGGAPEWPVSDTTFQTLVTLVADIARRNGLGKLVKGKNLTWHSMYAATACPGPYLSGKLQELVDKANTINGF